jgi:hypothetical protein
LFTYKSAETLDESCFSKTSSKIVALDYGGNSSDSNNNKGDKDDVVRKLSISRLHSKSLDSIHSTMLEANVSSLFEEQQFDELFPRMMSLSKSNRMDGGE